MAPKKYFSGMRKPSLRIAKITTRRAARPATNPQITGSMIVFVLQPERLIKQHDFKRFSIHGEERDTHETENLLAGKNVFNFVLNKRLPSFGLGSSMEPVADIK